MEQKLTKKKIFLDYIPTVVFAGLIIFFGIKNGQLFIEMLPCLISLIVMLLSANVNRFAFLLGGTNCFIYCIGYFIEGTYGSLAQTLLISMPLQYISFFNWKRNAYKKTSVQIQAYNFRQNILLAVISVLACALSCFVFSLIPSQKQPVLDGLVFMLGTLATVLSLMRHIEHIVFNLAGCIMGLIMWTVLVLNGNQSYSFMLISVYNLYRIIQSTVNWIKIYTEQQSINTKNK